MGEQGYSVAALTCCSLSSLSSKSSLGSHSFVFSIAFDFVSQWPGDVVGSSFDRCSKERRRPLNAWAAVEGGFSEVGLYLL